MKSNFQDDTRETEMIRLFELLKDEDQGGSGVDAFLQLKGEFIPFELKTTSTGSVSTVGDFGPNHIRKWKDVHWLFGFYKGNSIVYKYGSPAMMAPWIAEKAEYINSDFHLANLMPER